MTVYWVNARFGGESGVREIVSSTFELGNVSKVDYTTAVFESRDDSRRPRIPLTIPREADLRRWTGGTSVCPWHQHFYYKTLLTCLLMYQMRVEFVVEIRSRRQENAIQAILGSILCVLV